MIQNILSTLLLTSLVSAYPKRWITNEAGLETAYVVPRSQLESQCKKDREDYTCVEISQDVTRVEADCLNGGHPAIFKNIFDRRSDICGDIHCRTDTPLVVEFPQQDCNSYKMTMDLKGIYLNTTFRDSMFELTRAAFDGALRSGRTAQYSSCRPNPVGPPDLVDGCWDAGPKNIAVTMFGPRYGGQSMETSLSIVKEDEPNGCDFLMDVLTGAASRLSPEATNIFGEINGVCG